MESGTMKFIQINKCNPVAYCLAPPYVTEQGGHLQECSWHPFGKGWFGSEHERIYKVTYTDSSGNQHDATCKTSLLAGVYFTEDRLIHVSSDYSNKSEYLAEENARLRAQLKSIKDRTT